MALTSRLEIEKMRFLGKIGLVAMSGLLIHNAVLANTDAQITRYEQAKVRLSYEGSAGNLLQQLAQRLKVGFITYDVDISRKITIQNESETSIKTINEQITKQLSDADVRFEKIGNRLFLIVSAKGSEPLIQELSKKEEQFVGDIVFEGEDTTSKPAAPSEPNTVKEVEDNTTRLQEIFNIATDKARLAEAKNKKAPQYKTVSKENLGLKNIRVTPLGTFLIFDNKVDASKLKVKGKFEDMAQGENIIALLHQNSDAPKKIEVENSAGKKLILEIHTATQSQSKADKKSTKK